MTWKGTGEPAGPAGGSHVAPAIKTGFHPEKSPSTLGLRASLREMERINR